MQQWNVRSTGDAIFFVNVSSGSGSGSEEQLELIEFPLWRPILALLIATSSLLGLLILLVYGSILLTFAKTKSLHKPLSLVHFSLLIMGIILRLYVFVSVIIYLPPAVRYCICSPRVNDVNVSLASYGVTFRSVTFAYLSVAQLFIIKGRKRLVGYKAVRALIASTTAYSVLLGIMGLVIHKTTGSQYLCETLCSGANLKATTLSTYTIILIVIVVFILVPCLGVILAMVIWSCIVFKKSYVGGNNELNRRIISLPVIMPLYTILSAALVYALRETSEIILKAAVADFFANWVIIIDRILSDLFEGGGLFYPMILLYIHPQLRKAWEETFVALLRKTCFKKFKTSRVHPQRETI